MSFSALTCMTFTGNSPLSATLSVYADNNTSPFTTVALSAITGNECPFVLTGIPDGTTTITIRDTSNFCCLTMPVECCYGKTFQDESCFFFQDGNAYIYQDDPI